jgi:hypothetical protein
MMVDLANFNLQFKKMDMPMYSKCGTQLPTVCFVAEIDVMIFSIFSIQQKIGVFDSKQS